MEPALFEEIFDRLALSNLKAEVENTVLAACDSEQTLEILLNDAGFVSPAKPVAQTVAPEPKGAYLTSASVGGFRGISSEVTLNVHPGPGLTVIVGRNGSGKSSIAEGIEVLLTGGMRRLDDKSAVWKTGWRNLHGPGATVLQATLAIDKAGTTVVRRTWPVNATELGASEATVQERGGRVRPYSDLGWHDPLDQFRPILAHAELESFFRSPSQLHFLLASVLGLDEIEKVLNLLSAARRSAEKAVRDSKAALSSLLSELGTVDDERAERCLALLETKNPDLATANDIASGTVTPPQGGNLAWLHQVIAIAIPTDVQMSSISEGLEKAINDAAALQGTDASQADQTAQVLRAALAHYESHGPGPCPVCGTTGKLDTQWAEATKELATKLEETAAAVRKAANGLASAAGTARRLVQPVPSCLIDPKDSSPDVSGAVSAWSSWCRDDIDSLEPAALLEHLKTTCSPLTGAIAELKSSADAVLRAKQDAWTPVAVQVQTWCNNENTVRGRAAHVANIKLAEIWLKETNEALLNARLEPIKDAALHYWDLLRQGSDVALADIRLEGTKNKRTVEFDVEVDGTRGAALGVMSQGEVNALALSVFIPRATAPESPFRFLIIDDPIQAMDPAKVDGFARVLAEISTSRQLLVFTHDHRLTDAIRRLGIDATVLEVSRKPKSEVDITTILDPARRAIEEAAHIALDGNLADEVKRRLVGGYCRVAVEAHLLEMARDRLFKAGHTPTEVDTAVEAADSTNKMAALALHGDATKTKDVLSTLGKLHSWVPKYFIKVRDSAHIAVNDDLQEFLRDARAFVKVVV